MSVFDLDRSVLTLSPEQWDLIFRLVTGSRAQKPLYRHCEKAGLVDLGVVDSRGLTSPAQRVLSGVALGNARYSVRRLDPAASQPLVDVTVWLTPTDCTVQRVDSQGVHLSSCEAVEVPSIVLAYDHLFPRPMSDDSPDAVYDTLAGAVRYGSVAEAERVMRAMAQHGPRSSGFVRAAMEGQWTMVERFREDRRGRELTVTGDMLTLGTPLMLYYIDEPVGPPADPSKPPSASHPLVPVAPMDVWAAISSWLWANVS